VSVQQRIEKLERRLDPLSRDVRAEIDEIAILLADPETRALLIREAERQAGAPADG